MKPSERIREAVERQTPGYLFSPGEEAILAYLDKYESRPRPATNFGIEELCLCQHTFGWHTNGTEGPCSSAGCKCQSFFAVSKPSGGGDHAG